MSAPRVVLVDHRDSFVFVLADQLARVGADVDVVRAQMPLVAWEQVLQRQQPDLVVLSPGPGHPRDAKLAIEWLQNRPRTPVLGVCLGHQAIALAAGARVERLPQPAHGVACEVHWNALPFDFDGLPRRMPVARYHSLAACELTPTLTQLATSSVDDREVVMAIEHRELPQLGLQFHPESVLTPHGRELLRRVLGWAEQQSECSNREVNR